MSRRLAVELSMLVVAALTAFAVRSFVVAPYRIPSESMLPELMVGDTVLVEKWGYGRARRSLPLAGAAAAALPRRGDIIVFAAPPAGREAYVKRLIGLPGDRIALADGRVLLNGAALPRWRIADLVVPVTPNSPCRADAGTRIARETDPSGRRVCRYPRYREMLPGGRTYAILDVTRSDADDMPERIVPAGHLFVLGDNRDRSADSRFPAKEGGAVGMVPVEDLIGRARRVLLSIDGSGRWSDPATWPSAFRRERTGKAL